MRRLLRIIGWAALGIAGLVIAVFALTMGVHWMQLHRLHRLAQYPIQRYRTDTPPYFVLRNVKLIDGTGKDAEAGNSIVVRDGKIAWVGVSAEMPPQPGAAVLNLQGATVIPGLVMLHEHLFTSQGNRLVQQATTFPLLYLAGGVTTARTTGSIDPVSDLRVKQRVDNGDQAGPELFLTAPYLEGSPAMFSQMHVLTGAEDATLTVNNYLRQGFTSLKAYADITPDELRAAINAAHAKGAIVTGHLCSITFTQAAEMGIDNLEHGLLTDTEFYSGKKENVCPSLMGYLKEYQDKLDVDSPAVTQMMDLLIAKHIPVTSTLAVFEGELAGGGPEWYQAQVKKTVVWKTRLITHMIEGGRMKEFRPLIVKEMKFERKFVQRGGTLLAGSDPTGDGSVLAGYGDLREIELLHAAGFSTAQAIHIATLEGANFLGIAGRAGSIEPGKQADLVVIDGDPSQRIEDIRNVRTVYRRGQGFDSQKMMQDVSGIVGLPN